MTRSMKVGLILVVASLASYSFAHSGRTDSSGGHNCSQKSKDKGLCTGYHYHNGSSIDESHHIDVEMAKTSNKSHKVSPDHSHGDHADNR
jgi:hypothetical protein